MLRKSLATWFKHSFQPVNVWVEKGKAASLMSILADLITNDNFGDQLIRNKFWVPYAFRILTASLTSIECRSWLIRNPRFIQRQCSQDLDSEELQVYWLDLLLSLTSFSDGQMWLAKNNELLDLLVDKAHDNLPALAILRNLSFHPSARPKLLLLPNYLGLLAQCLQCSEKTEEIKTRLAWTSIWALAANCHKAKVILNRFLPDIEACNGQPNFQNVIDLLSI